MTRRVALVSLHHRAADRSGGMRSRALARLLPDCGWEPTIITLPPPGSPSKRSGHDVDVIAPRTPGLARMGRWFSWPVPGARSGEGGSLVRRAWRAGTLRVLAVPDWYRSAIAPLADALQERIEMDGIDAVISTSGPASAHLIAHRAVTATGSPWIADFRDLWTQSPYFHHGPLRARVERRMESRVLRDATMITATSRHFARSLSARSGRPATAIYTGVPEEGAGPLERATRGPRLVIAHAGSLYGGRRDPTHVIRAARRLSDDGVPSVVRFIGSPEPWLDDLVRSLDAQEHVETTGPMPHDRCLAVLANADVLLVLGWDHPSDLGSIPYKLFECASLGPPMLLHGFAEGAEVLDLADGLGALHGRDEDAIVDLLRAVHGRRRGAGDAADPVEAARRAGLTQRDMARSFAALLDATK